jgi:hypothetical protein
MYEHKMPLETRETDLIPRVFLERAGRVFATFDARTQDSGNVSFGVEADGARYFVKTAGDSADTKPVLKHSERVLLLMNAAKLAGDFQHPALPALHNIIASPWGPMLIYQWAEGDLVGAPAEKRSDPASAFQRFRALPLEQLIDAIGVIVEVHQELEARGWVACDFYDRSMIYDFARRKLSLIDLDNYSQGPFVNEMGRMFGSTRFMAPEEFERGAMIDDTTTVFVMGRVMSVFLGDGALERSTFSGSGALYELMLHACTEDREARPQSVHDFALAWRAAIADISG